MADILCKHMHAMLKSVNMNLNILGIYAGALTNLCMPNEKQLRGEQVFQD